MWYQLSPFTGSNVAIAMQHDPGNLQHPDKSFSSWTSYSNPLPLDSWQVSCESYGGSWISFFAKKENQFYSDLKHDPLRRPREMKTIDPRLRSMMPTPDRSFIKPERQLHFANPPN